MDHIDHVIVPNTHTSMYMLHKYWARKPDNVVRAYVERYCPPGGIVLDPFVGSGVTALEAVRTGRRAIATDLNPIATFITENTATPCSIAALNSELDRIKQEAEHSIRELYKTTCPQHPSEHTEVLCGIWEGPRLTDKWTHCTDLGNIKRPATNSDRAQIKRIASDGPPYWVPDFTFPAGVVFDQAIREAGSHLRDLFTPRAWVALSILFNSIRNSADPQLMSLLSMTFTSLLAQVSKMVPQREGAGLAGNVGWTVNSYWVPRMSREFNVWNSFLNRFTRLVRGKTETNNSIPAKPATSYRDLKAGKGNILIKTLSALDLDTLVPARSVDYIGRTPRPMFTSYWPHSMWNKGGKGLISLYRSSISLRSVDTGRPARPSPWLIVSRSVSY